MKDHLARLWIVIAIALIVPTTTFDLNNFLGPATPRTPDVWRLPSWTRARQPANSRLAYRQSEFSVTLCPGESTTIQFPVFLPPAPLRADVLFAFDTTGSMDGVIDGAQATAFEIIGVLRSLIEDVQFGLIDFRDYPITPYGNADDWPYQLRQPITDSVPAVRSAINELDADGGLNSPEAYTRAFYESYADTAVSWRSGSRRLIVAFGDSVPHDDDLNASVPTPQPYLPGQVWETGYPPSHLDPGRDATIGTDDDLDFQVVLAEMRDQGITLLFVVADGNFLGLLPEALLVYWRYWAGLTAPGGDAVILENTGDLPATIQALVASAVRHVDHLALIVLPAEYRPWVVIDPAAFTNFVIDPEGTTKIFEITISVPLDVGPGEYTFDLQVEIDGTIHDSRPVTAEVPGRCFATPTPTPTPIPPPTPRPRWMIYLPMALDDFVHP